MELSDPRSAEGRLALDAHLLQQSYVGGAAPSQADTQVFNRLGGGLPQGEGGQVENLARWLANMNSYGAAERKGWPASTVPVTIAHTEEVRGCVSLPSDPRMSHLVLAYLLPPPQSRRHLWSCRVARPNTLCSSVVVFCFAWFCLVPYRVHDDYQLMVICCS